MPLKLIKRVNFFNIKIVLFVDCMIRIRFDWSTKNIQEFVLFFVENDALNQRVFWKFFFNYRHSIIVSIHQIPIYLIRHVYNGTFLNVKGLIEKMNKCFAYIRWLIILFSTYSCYIPCLFDIVLYIRMYIFSQWKQWRFSASYGFYLQILFT